MRIETPLKKIVNTLWSVPPQSIYIFFVFLFFFVFYVYMCLYFTTARPHPPQRSLAETPPVRARVGRARKKKPQGARQIQLSS